MAVFIEFAIIFGLLGLVYWAISRKPDRSDEDKRSTGDKRNPD
ncbi:hypothetical protein MNBD_GAMMA18-2347 [hydrothermal vent metagenome]|uniref:Uncharacterized protein n=1 Tax=hydrothermal vent metagenome TaxID=652676 RepID=A0A3B0ZG86_9ZZZZ